MSSGEFYFYYNGWYPSDPISIYIEVGENEISLRSTDNIIIRKFTSGLFRDAIERKILVYDVSKNRKDKISNLDLDN